MRDHGAKNVELIYGYSGQTFKAMGSVTGRWTHPLKDKAAIDGILDQMRVLKGGMTRRHYDAFVKVIREIDEQLKATLPDDLRKIAVETVTARIALMCAHDNPNFDAFKFTAAVEGRRT